LRESRNLVPTQENCSGGAKNFEADFEILSINAEENTILVKTTCKFSMVNRICNMTIEYQFDKDGKIQRMVRTRQYVTVLRYDLVREFLAFYLWVCRLAFRCYRASSNDLQSITINKKKVASTLRNPLPVSVALEFGRQDSRCRFSLSSISSFWSAPASSPTRRAPCGAKYPRDPGEYRFHRNLAVLLICSVCHGIRFASSFPIAI